MSRRGSRCVCGDDNASLPAVLADPRGERRPDAGHAGPPPARAVHRTATDVTPGPDMRRRSLGQTPGVAQSRDVTSRHLFVAPLLALVGLAGCGITDFDIDQDLVEQRIEGSLLGGPLAAVFAIPLNLDLQADIAAHDTGPIDSVTLSSLTLTITGTARTDGDADDWSFVDRIDVYVKPTAGSSLMRRRIATVSNPGPVTALHFDVDDGVDLQPYVEQGATIDTEGSGTEPPDDVTFDGRAVFTVHPL